MVPEGDKPGGQSGHEKNPRGQSDKKIFFLHSQASAPHGDGSPAVCLCEYMCLFCEKCRWACPQKLLKIVGKK
jgi:formate hydrogenlyase subunit 6/NADH:ubiquinone oxidoreductase subunit I